MKNFLVGLALGVFATWWWLTQTGYTQSMLSQWWARASSSPPIHAPAGR